MLLIPHRQLRAPDLQKQTLMASGASAVASVEIMTDSTAEGFTLVGSSEATILPYQEQQQNAWPDYSPSRLPSMNASEAASQQPSVVPASELSAMVQAFMEDAAGSAERECDAAEDADALAFKSIESFNILCVGESGLGKSTFLRDIFAHLDPTKFHEARRRVAAQRERCRNGLRQESHGVIISAPRLASVERPRLRREQRDPRLDFELLCSADLIDAGTSECERVGGAAGDRHRVEDDLAQFGAERRQDLARQFLQVGRGVDLVKQGRRGMGVQVLLREGVRA
jgi:hypothetical protein